MKVSKIINAVQTYDNYCQKIARYKAKQVEYDQWDDYEGVHMMEKKIAKTEKDLGRFLDSEV